MSLATKNLMKGIYKPILFALFIYSTASYARVDISHKKVQFQFQSNKKIWGNYLLRQVTIHEGDQLKKKKIKNNDSSIILKKNKIIFISPAMSDGFTQFKTHEMAYNKTNNNQYNINKEHSKNFSEVLENTEFDIKNIDLNSIQCKRIKKGFMCEGSFIN